MDGKGSAKRLLWKPIAELDLPARPLNVLHGAGITTLADLVRRSEAELDQQPDGMSGEGSRSRDQADEELPQCQCGALALMLLIVLIGSLTRSGIRQREMRMP